MWFLRLCFVASAGLFVAKAGEATGPAAPEAAGTEQAVRRETHPLVGAWLATDGTVFRFREDGTFVGIDYRAREIWGNWVRVNESRIGFQSLFHRGQYAPQYAVISDNPNVMNYIYSQSDNFIKAERITDKDAEAIIAEEAKKSVILPREP
jgi:hypothetical protein